MRISKVSLLLVMGLCLGLGFAGSEAKEKKAKNQKFSGSYDWKQGGSDELTAEFKPDGEDRWKVTFRFRWGGNDNSWKGSAEGSWTRAARSPAPPPPAVATGCGRPRSRRV